MSVDAWITKRHIVVLKVDQESIQLPALLYTDANMNAPLLYHWHALQLFPFKDSIQ